MSLPEPPCSHPATEVRMRTDSIGRPSFRLQCLTCGVGIGAYLVKSSWPAAAPPWNETLSEEHWKARQERHRARAEADAERDRAAWYEEHADYMKTSEWARLRRAVHEREGGICQGCRNAQGTQAHHLTYERWRKELIIDLAWLCRDCHVRIHAAPVPRISAE